MKEKYSLLLEELGWRTVNQLTNMKSKVKINKLALEHKIELFTKNPLNQHTIYAAANGWKAVRT